MKKLLPLLLCLSLSFFTVARATRSGYAENKSFDMSDAEREEVAADQDTDEEVVFADNISTEDASDDKGENMNDDSGGAGDASDEDISDGDGGSDDGADDGDDDGGGDKGD